MDKRTTRLRRSRRPRSKIRELAVPRVCVHRTPRHIYAQVIAVDGGTTVASASTLDAEVKKEIGTGGNVTAARVVGRVLAERAKSAGVESAAFDRSGFKYHGRVKALAEAAREAGLRC